MITPEAQRLLAAKAQREANAGLVQSFVGRGVTLPIVVTTMPPSAPVLVERPERKTRQPFAKRGKNIDRVRAWLATAKVGDTVTYKDLGMPRAGEDAMGRLVRQGRLKLKLKAIVGRGGRPNTYVKV